MNLYLINKEFEKLSKIEDYINYKFEPRCKLKKGGKRHIYFNDLKKDFTDEINAYGFSPYIQETYYNQKRDKEIMRFKTNYLNQGLINYVKKKNQGLTKTEKFKMRPTSKQETTNRYHNLIIDSSIESTSKNHLKQDKHENFLKKALDNLARNKLDLSSEEFKFEEEDNPESSRINSFRKSQKNKINQMKSTFLESIGIKVQSNRALSAAKVNSAKMPKLNYTNYFNNLKPNGNKENQNKIRKLVRLVNNNQIEEHQRKDRFLENELIEENKNREIKIPKNKENPELKLITRMHTTNLNLKKRGNSSDVFKKLSNLRISKNFNSTKKNLLLERQTEEIDESKFENNSVHINLAMKIFSKKTKEKERKFMESEKKIFKSRHSLLRKFTFI